MSFHNGGDFQEEVVDFVVLCTGKFGDIPNIPKFPPGGGPKAFKNGKVLHYIEYAALDFDTATKHVKDKKIAIVGFQKSALELIRECTNLIGNFSIFLYFFPQASPSFSSFSSSSL